MTENGTLTAISGLAAATTLALLAWVNLNVQSGEDGGLVPLLVTAGIAAVVWAFVFGWYGRRSSPTARGGIVAGVFAVVSLAAFWSGLPVLLGAAAIAFGSEGRVESPRAGRAAIALGVLALVATAAALVHDQLT